MPQVKLGRPTIDNKREIEIRFRVNEEENEMLKNLVSYNQMNVSEYLRLLIQADYKELNSFLISTQKDNHEL